VVEREIDDRGQRLPLRRVEIHHYHFGIDRPRGPHDIRVALPRIRLNRSVLHQVAPVEANRTFLALGKPDSRCGLVRIGQRHGLGDLARQRVVIRLRGPRSLAGRVVEDERRHLGT
jgi:hypothetical protein